MPQNYNACQEKAVEQTFVVDCSRLLSFAVGYSIGLQEVNKQSTFSGKGHHPKPGNWLTRG